MAYAITTAEVGSRVWSRKCIFFISVLEWGSSHFNNVVPNGVTNYDRFLRTPNTSKSVSFQDSHTHIAPGSNLVTYASPEEKKLKLRQNTSQQRLTTMTPATYYMNGDSVGTTMQDFHRERVNAQMTRERSRPATSYMRQVCEVTFIRTTTPLS